MRSCNACQTSYPDTLETCPQDGTPLRPEQEWRPGAVIRGRYEIQEEIGRDRVTVVYRAHDQALGETRALKSVLSGLLGDAGLVKLFKQESRIAQSLRHPNVVRVEANEDAEDGRPCLITEYVEGRDLRTVIRNEAPLAAPRVCSIARQVAAALDAAHRLGMVHRDLQPAQIMIVAAPGGERVKVLDFGMGRVKESRLRGRRFPDGNPSLDRLIVGSPKYMSPEQAAGKVEADLDGRSDLYSLGVIMYEMLSGRLPCAAPAGSNGDSTLAALVAQIEDAPRPLDAVFPPVPEPLAALVMKLLEKRREMRLPTAQLLVEELERIEKAIAPLVVDEPEWELSLPAPKSALNLGAQELIPAPAAEPEAVVAEAPLETLPLAPVTEIPLKANPPEAGVPMGTSPYSTLFKTPEPPRSRPRWLKVAAAVVVVVGGVLLFTVYRPRVTNSTIDELTRRYGPPQSPAPVTERASTPPVQPAVSPPQTSAQNANPPASIGSQTPSPAWVETSPAAPAAPDAADGSSSNPQTSQSALAPPSTSRTAGGGTKASSLPSPPGKPAPARVDPALIRATIAEGDGFFELGDYDRAIAVYERALKIDPGIKALKQRVDRTRKAKAAEDKYLSQ